MLIDSSYFDTTERNVPNTGQADVLSSLNSLIAFREKEYLNKVLGYELSKAFLEGLDVGSDEIPDQKWLDIRDGVEFSIYGRLNKWEGLINDDKSSPIADYVYYWYLVGKVNHVSGTGQVQAKNENSEIVSSANQQVQAWNDMVDKTRFLSEFLYQNYTVYPEYRDYYYGGWYVGFSPCYGGYGLGVQKINAFDI